MYTHYLLIGLGGGLGAIMRVILSQALPLTVAGIPVPILVVNILGCFFIGLLSELFAFYGTLPDSLKYFLVPGFLGGFTTFSSFALEFGVLYERGEYYQALTYVLFSLILSLLAFMVALKLVRSF